MTQAEGQPLDEGDLQKLILVQNSPMYEHVDLVEFRSIRLLELLPSSRTRTKIIIRLKEVNLDDFPAFEAVSQAWEGQEADQSIICDGNELLVSSTCKAALRRLRHKLQSRILWIDQICICFDR